MNNVKNKVDVDAFSDAVLLAKVKEQNLIVNELANTMSSGRATDHL